MLAYNPAGGCLEFTELFRSRSVVVQPIFRHLRTGRSFNVPDKRSSRWLFVADCAAVYPFSPKARALLCCRRPTVFPVL